MRKQKEITLGDDLKVTVKELRVRTIVGLFDQKDATLPLAQRFDDLLPEACSLGKEALLDLVPSELEEIWVAFREVNAAFFSLAAKMGLKDLIEAVKVEIRKVCAAPFAARSALATDKESGITVGASS